MSGATIPAGESESAAGLIREVGLSHFFGIPRGDVIERILEKKRTRWEPNGVDRHLYQQFLWVVFSADADKLGRAINY